MSDDAQYAAIFHVFRRLAIGILFAICAIPAIAQDKPPLQTPMFPSNFRGEDCDAIAAALKGRAIRKDEFESTADYEKRAEAMFTSVSVSGRPLAESRYFVNSDQISAVYNADKGLMKVYGSLRHSTKVSDTIRYASTVIVKTRSAQKNQYEGQNLYGASTTVDKYRDEVCGVAFLNVSPVTDHEWMGQIEFPLPADIARRSKGNIVIAYLARLAPPFLIDYRQYIAPTMSAPSEILVTGDALTAVLERFIVLNKTSGEVLYDRVYTPK